MTNQEDRKIRFHFKSGNNYKVPIPAKTLEQAIEWANNRSDRPDEGDCILDDSIYDMMVIGSLHLANIVVARVQENKWMVTDYREVARDRFFKLPEEKRDAYISKFEPEFHNLFSEDRPSELKLDISHGELLSGRESSRTCLWDIPVIVTNLPAKEPESPSP